MEIKILHSIIHKELMPWRSDLPANKLLAESIKKAGTKNPANEKELMQQLKALLSNHAELVAWLDKQPQDSNNSLVQQYCIINLPAFTDTITKFYSLVISKECDRVFNTFLTRSAKWTNPTDINYHTNILLKNIKTLTSQTIKEIKERGFEETVDAPANHVSFALHYLRLSLLSLYFSVQEITKNSLEQTITLDDLYLLDFNQPVSVLPVMECHNEADNEPGENKGKQENLSFGFKGVPEKLKTVISQLCRELELLNQTKSSQEELFKVLTAKKLTPSSTQIYIGCETAQFRYVLDKFKIVFTNLKFTSIERTAIFYSKNGTLLKAQNLSASKIENPKTKETIDNIFKHLQ